jgi:hypothetical protein
MDRINVAQLEAGRDRWQPLDALGAYDLAPSLRRVASPLLIMMGGHFHYTKDLPALRALSHHSEAEVIAGARFCATWSHAEHIAARTFTFMGV